MAFILSLEEIDKRLAANSARLSYARSLINLAQREADNMLREQIDPDAISTQINALLADISAILDQVGPDIMPTTSTSKNGTLKLTYRERVQVAPELGYDYVLIDHDNSAGDGHLVAGADLEFAVTAWSKPSNLQVNHDNHGLSTGDYVRVLGTNQATVNVVWQITVVDGDNFTLDGSSGETTPTTEGSYCKQCTPFDVFQAGDIVEISGAEDSDNNAVVEIAASGVLSDGAGLKLTGDITEDTSENRRMVVELLER